MTSPLHDSGPLTVGILTVGDPAEAGGARSEAAGDIRLAAEKMGWRVEVEAAVPADERQIRASLVDLCVENRVDLVLTLGGTGFGPRGVTPEATKQVIEKEIPGLAEIIRQKGGRNSPAAALSRGLAGVRRRSLILNLPGSPKAALAAFHAVAEILPHAVRMVRHDAAG